MTTYLAAFCAAFIIAGATAYFGVNAFTRSAPEVILPDLEGKNIMDVLEILTRMGLNPKLQGTQFHESIPRYGVCFQDPKPGSTIKKGRDVGLFLSKGFKEVQVPDLRQVQFTQALILLEDNEILPGRITHVHAKGTLKGSIIAQYPLALARIPAGKTCDLLVSKGPRPVMRSMPDLKDLSLSSALDTLSGLSLSPGQIRSEFDPLQPLGSVLAQTPAPGGPVPETQAVTLVVNARTQGEILDMEVIQTPVWIPFQVPQGFANQHIQVTWDLFGQQTDLYNTFIKPGKNINLLIPGGIPTKIRIFINHKLVLVKEIGPWNSSAHNAFDYWNLDLNSGVNPWE